MRRTNLAAVLAIALGYSVAIAAQSTSPAPGQQTSPPSGGQSRQNASVEQQDQVRIIGCVQRTGVTAAEPAGSASGGYVLANARMAAGTAGESPTSTAPGGATRPPAGRDDATRTQPAGEASAANRDGHGSAAMTTYALQSGASDLTPHVGHQVEITGVVASTTPTRDGARTETPRPSDRPASSATNPAGTSGTTTAPSVLRVSSVRMISATCER